MQTTKIDERCVPTLNQNGFMLTIPHAYSQAFIDYAPLAQKRVLDIGASFGAVTIPALLKGANVIANDMSAEHLNLLKENVPFFAPGHLEISVGRIPTEVDFEVESIGGVLASGVLHYLTPDELVLAFKKIHNWLIPGGKFFFSTSSPYTGMFRDFLPIFEERQKNGDPWPGLIEDVHHFVPHLKDQIPKTMILMDEDFLRNFFTSHGFEIEKIGYVPMQNDIKDFNLDGRESIGIIASKPSL